MSRRQAVLHALSPAFRDCSCSLVAVVRSPVFAYAGFELGYFPFREALNTALAALTSFLCLRAGFWPLGIDSVRHLDLPVERLVETASVYARGHLEGRRKPSKPVHSNPEILVPGATGDDVIAQVVSRSPRALPVLGSARRWSCRCAPQHQRAVS
jgi:hypothetical protein